jgi:hypothetical protein
MKKVFFLLALGGFLISAPLQLWAADNEEMDKALEEIEKISGNDDYSKNFNITARPCRVSIYDSSFALQEHLATIKLTEENFSSLDEHPEKEEVELYVTDMIPLFVALRKKGWIVEQYEKKTMRDQYNNGHSKGITEGRELAAKERSIWEKHPKKIIAGAAIICGAAGYYFGSKH